MAFGVGVLVAEVVFFVFLLLKAFIVMMSSFLCLSEGLLRARCEALEAGMSQALLEGYPSKKLI